MRRKSKAVALWLLCAAAVLFVGAFFLGRASVSGVRIETKKHVSGSEQQASAQTWLEQAQKTAQTAAPEKRLCLNTATLEDLLTLPGIGEKTAQRIVDYRQKYGRFVTVEQLQDIQGIGETLLEQLRAYVYVEDDYENSGR